MILNALNQLQLSHNIHLSIHPHTPCVYILYPCEHTCFMKKACSQSFGHTILLCEWLSTWTKTLFSDCITSYRCLIFEPRVATVTHRVRPLLCSYLHRTTITHTHTHTHTHTLYRHSCLYHPRSHTHSISSFLFLLPTIALTHHIVILVCTTYDRTTHHIVIPLSTAHDLTHALYRHLSFHHPRSHTRTTSSFLFAPHTIAHTYHVDIYICIVHDRTHTIPLFLFLLPMIAHTNHIAIPICSHHDRSRAI